MKKIAMDFDDTYTAMPEIWDSFISACIAAGHQVTIVTARADSDVKSYNHDIRQVCYKHGIDVVYTHGDQKSEHFEADIWIDDNPDWIPSMELVRSMVLMDGIHKSNT